jgi:hypothetical protein
MSDPDCSIADGDTTCAIAHWNRGDDSVGLRVDAKKHPSIAIVNPDGAIVSRYAIICERAPIQLA